MYEERPSKLRGSVAWRRMTTPGPVRIVPDGCMDLIWTSDWDLFVAGPDTRPQILTSPPGRTYDGIRFAPGVGPAVLGIPAHELVNRRVPLDEIWRPAEVGRLTTRLAGSDDPRCALEAAATERLRGLNGVAPLIAEIVRLLRAGHAVAAVADHVALGERQLRRRSLDAFGYGPKTLARIVRFGRAMDLARSGVPWADAAGESGYADQAHLAREVRSLAGATMTQLTG